MEQNRRMQNLSMENIKQTKDEAIEKQFLCNANDAFAIYQLRHHKSTRDYRFQPMEQLQAAGLSVKRENYETVYTGLLRDMNGKTNLECLEELYFRFNLDRPGDFEGHSLSVSDIVALKVDGVATAHYVDRYGWQELKGFLPEQMPRSSEMRYENVHGKKNGIVNKEMHIPDEKRSSVVEQLRKTLIPVPRKSGNRKQEPIL